VLEAVDPEAASEVLLRLLSVRRGDLVAERTRALNRLHGLLQDLVPGGIAGNALDPPSRAHRAWGIQPKGGVSARLRGGWLRRSCAKRPDTGSKDREPKRERIEAEVDVSDTTLTEIFGIGPILAAKIIGTG